MYYFLTASKDATIYLQQPNQNTGLDDILEISKVYYGNVKDISRVLIQFDTQLISQSISDGDIQLDDVRLILRETESEEITLNYDILTHPISGAWEMGIGTRFDEISTTGVTWNFREGDSRLRWVSDGIFESGSTGNSDGRGGAWYEYPSSSQRFEYQTADIDMDVKEMVEYWISGTLSNNGMILKYPSEYENNTNDYGILKFFGKETHTIHQPKIRIGWDTQIFQTGSLSELTSTDILIGVRGLKNEYNVNKKTKLNIFARELYPLKTFSPEFRFNIVKFLPSTTFYQIRDLHSDDIIIPFSEYSKVSCDESGNYIDINFTNWEVGRDYKIEFKVIRDGDEYYYDNDDTFTIVK
jgi:hypothetical protein